MDIASMVIGASVASAAWMPFVPWTKKRHRNRRADAPQASAGTVVLAAAGTTTSLSAGASGAVRTFAGWVARGSVGHPLLDDVDYWDVLREEPSSMETLFAVFANVLELDEAGEPVNEKYAERRAAVWLYQYCTGAVPDGEREIEEWEAALF